MYSKNIKNQVRKTLLNKDGTSTNPWIYRDGYIFRKGLEDLILECKKVTSFVKSNRLDERLYCILNDITEVPKCSCGKAVEFKRFQLGYRNYCSVKCRANDYKWQEKTKQTVREKYGVDYIAQLPEEKVKRSKQMKEHRPFFDYSGAAVKRKETIKRLYGEHYNSGWTERAIQTRIDNGTMVPIEILDEYREYRKKVELITKKQPIHLLENFEKRGIFGKDEDAHHIDHIVSIYECFMNDVDPEIAGSIHNLQCIPARDNIVKGNDSWMSVEELFERYRNSET